MAGKLPSRLPHHPYCMHHHRAHRSCSSVTELTVLAAPQMDWWELCFLWGCEGHQCSDCYCHLGSTDYVQACNHCLYFSLTDYFCGGVAKWLTVCASIFWHSTVWIGWPYYFRGGMPHSPSRKLNASRVVKQTTLWLRMPMQVHRPFATWPMLLGVSGRKVLHCCWADHSQP